MKSANLLTSLLTAAAIHYIIAIAHYNTGTEQCAIETLDSEHTQLVAPCALEVFYEVSLINVFLEERTQGSLHALLEQAQ